ncbi:MAG: hypothetical protein FK734_20080 [Asgard group archaeon]|nr:hypothetical protein [Asgard group archaeon]
MVLNLNNNNIQITDSNQVRSLTSSYRRYYHIPLGAFDPGASGATYTSANNNTVGGWQLDAAGEILEATIDIHYDWDGASDLKADVKFEVNIDNTGGNVSDTVDLKLTLYYKGDGDISTKTQIIEVATIVGQSPRYKSFHIQFTIDWDAVDNIIESGDILFLKLNLETDTSEVDNIIINHATIYYNTMHVGIESGDV